LGRSRPWRGIFSKDTHNNIISARLGYNFSFGSLAWWKN
jgi:hypothetical protein